jgi:hypothetical protein
MTGNACNVHFYQRTGLRDRCASELERADHRDQRARREKTDGQSEESPKHSFHGMATLDS